VYAFVKDNATIKVKVNKIFDYFKQQCIIFIHKSNH